MCHVQQKKLTALHLKPKILRRDIGATVDSDFPSQLLSITEEMEGLEWMM